MVAIIDSGTDIPSKPDNSIPLLYRDGGASAVYNPRDEHIYTIVSPPHPTSDNQPTALASVKVINIRTNTLVNSIPVGSSFFSEAGIAYNPLDGYMYVTNSQDNTVSLISPVPNTSPPHVTWTRVFDEGNGIDALAQYRASSNTERERLYSIIYGLHPSQSINMTNMTNTGTFSSISFDFSANDIDGDVIVRFRCILDDRPIACGNPNGQRTSETGTFTVTQNDLAFIEGYHTLVIRATDSRGAESCCEHYESAYRPRDSAFFKWYIGGPLPSEPIVPPLDCKDQPSLPGCPTEPQEFLQKDNKNITNENQTTIISQPAIK